MMESGGGRICCLYCAGNGKIKKRIIDKMQKSLERGKEK